MFHLFILTAASFAAPPDSLAPDAEMVELVRRLGHNSFAVRESAGRELVKAGAKAVPALTAGVADPDPEVAARCRKLLPAAAAAGRGELLARLVKDPAGTPPPKGLAGCDRFLKITGDTADTRRVYAEMMGAHHAILEAMEADPQAGSRLMADFSAEAYGRWQRNRLVERRPEDAVLADGGQVALFMVVRSDRRFAADGAYKTATPSAWPPLPD